MIAITNRSTRPGWGIALALLFAAPMAAQEGSTEVDVQELVRQVRRNMVEVEKDIDRASAEAAKSGAAAVERDLKKLIDQMQARGQQITTDIDEIIANIPP